MGQHVAAEAARKTGQIAVLERLERTIVSRKHWWWAAAMILALVLIMFGVGIATLPDSSPEQVLLGAYSIEAGVVLGVLCFLYGLVVELIVWRRAERRSRSGRNRRPRHRGGGRRGYADPWPDRETEIWLRRTGS